jgi:hypothetical protein
MLKVTGGILLALGLAAGATLVASPFGLFSSALSSLATWVLFPVSFAAGCLLLALAAPNMALGWLWRLCAKALLALACASALGLMLPLLGFLEPAYPTLSLWYVLVLAGVLGTACALGPGSSPTTS